FFIEDIIRRADRDPDGTEDDLAIVMRHWHDSDPANTPPEYRGDPLNRELQQGEIGISYLVSGEHEIVREEDYYIVDRSLQPGDLVKRSVHDVQSGVVLESNVEVKLEHAVSMVQYAGWVSSDELENATEVYVGDYVVYDDWVGLVEEIFDEAIAGMISVTLSCDFDSDQEPCQIELTSQQLFCFAELGGRFQIGDRGAEVLPEAALQELQKSTTALPEVLVSVKPTVLAIAWLAVNQTLDREAAAAKQRPKRFWTMNEFRELCLVRPRYIFRISDRVRFKNASVAEMHGVRTTRHGHSGVGIGLIESDVLVVRETRTTVRILWQNGVIQPDVPSKDVIPYVAPDEYDCWPGDYVIWKGEDETRAAVIQSVTARDRTAQVLWRSPPATHHPRSKPPSHSMVSVLELDPHGSSTPAPDQPDAVGVRRGDFVFVHRPRVTNGLPLPRIPKIGELEGWVRSGNPNGWRQEMTLLGIQYAERHNAARNQDQESAAATAMDEESRIIWRDPADIDWFGEVTDLELSGEIEVTLPSGEVVLAPLELLTLLIDGREILPAAWGDEGIPVTQETVINGINAGMFGNVEAISQVLGNFWGLPSAGGGVHDHEMDGWETGSESMDVDEGEDIPPLVEMDPPTEESHTTTLIESREFTPASSPPLSPNPPTDGHHVSAPPGASKVQFGPNGVWMPEQGMASARKGTLEEGGGEDEEGGPWKKFHILPSAPEDHAFLKRDSRGQPSRQFMARLSKEYKLLSSGLPDSILVRGYEDRADLLRSLIIGPENTPYEGAPFVIDWLLDENFPQTPPVAHFHSWTNGNGRVNPNLYEEGKVCLSILGTWAGDKSECWSPARSSLMQALVSIQGLVLVKEPWFCEPAYEKLRGTQEGIVNSRLYSEKAYVLSMGFVRRALEMPPLGLEKEIEWVYWGQGRLAKVIDDAKALIEISRSSSSESMEDVMRTLPGWEDKAIPKLTAGGILTLERTLNKLEGLRHRQWAQ
ncbi:hypothetical protein FRB99_008571, partial [Tulasnella sp. 403]